MRTNIFENMSIFEIQGADEFKGPGVYQHK
jgi:hypothetical protein